MGDEPDWDSIFLKDDAENGRRSRKSDENLMINDTKEYSLLSDQRLNASYGEDLSSSLPLPDNFVGLRYPGLDTLPAAIPSGLHLAGKGKRPASPGTKLPGRPPGPPPPTAFLYKPVTPNVVVNKKQKSTPELILEEPVDELPPRPPGPPPAFALQPPPLAVTPRLTSPTGPRTSFSSSPPSTGARTSFSSLQSTGPRLSNSSSSSPSLPSSTSFQLVQAVKSMFLPNKPVFDVSSLAQFPSIPESQSMIPSFSMGPQMFGGLFPGLPVTDPSGLRTQDTLTNPSFPQFSEELSRTSQLISESLLASSLERDRKATVVALTPPSFPALPALTPLSNPTQETSKPQIVTMASVSPISIPSEDSPRSLSPDSPRIRGKLSQANSRVHKKQAAVLHRRRLNEKFKALAEACGCGHARRPTILRRAVDTVTALQERIHQLELEAAEHKAEMERIRSASPVGSPSTTPKSHQDNKTLSPTNNTPRRLKVSLPPTPETSSELLDLDKDTKFSSESDGPEEPQLILTNPEGSYFKIDNSGSTSSRTPTPHGLIGLGGSGRNGEDGDTLERSPLSSSSFSSSSLPSSSSLSKNDRMLIDDGNSLSLKHRKQHTYSFSSSSSSPSSSGTSSPPSPISPSLMTFQTPWNPCCIIDLSIMKPGAGSNTVGGGFVFNPPTGSKSSSPSHTPTSSISSISSIVSNSTQLTLLSSNHLGPGLGLIVDCNPVFAEFLECSKRDILNRLYTEDILGSNCKELVWYGLSELCESHHRVAHILLTYVSKRNNRKYGRCSFWLDPSTESHEGSLKDKEEDDDDEPLDPGLSISLRTSPKRLCICAMQPLTKEKFDSTRRAWKALDPENPRIEVQFDD